MITPDTINMSLQVCHCGWSKVTSYHGLRTHQGKMGCTPKGMHIPESKGLSFLPPVTFMSPQIKDPVLDILNIPWKYDLKVKEIMSIPEKQPHVWRNPDQKDSTPLSSTPAKEEILNMSDLSLQEMTGCPPRIPEDKGWRNGSFAQLTFITPPDTPEETAVDIFSTKSVVENQQQTVQMGGSSDKTHQRLDAQALQTFSSQMCPAAADVTVKEMNQPFFGTPQRSHPTTAKLDKARRVLDFSTGAQQVQQTCDSLFQRHDGTQIQFNPVYHIQQVVVGLPPNTAQETTVSLNENELEKERERERQRELEKERERERQRELEKERERQRQRELEIERERQRQRELEKERERQRHRELEIERERQRQKELEAQKQLKARQDRKRAELQHKVKIRENQVAQVRSSVKGCKVSLDAEWLEINSAFSEVIKVVEDARQKALQPLEERREKIKREEQALVQKLEKEIDKLKKSIEEVDKNPDLQISPDKPGHWKNVSVDTSFSFGTLRTTTSAMMEEIRQKLETLCSVELMRIPTFAVDVKLDSTTAHQCLVLSDDGKKVRDGGKTHGVPDTPKRFNLYGSILGLNSLTSGRSYWEVEVSNKTGWDLGVARGDANRKGKLSLNPHNGYWVTVHYEGKRYAALSAPPVSLSLKQKPQKVGVFVDYEEGLVSFYDVTAQSHIYSFTGCSFGGEIFPYFSPHLNQNGKNSEPLIISAVETQWCL
ncbi:hypothetical protein INR49_005460 [Caranx melampygus]|nr:hypothetical protein INR49_005460 [Caranx melampygus]